MSDAYTPPQVWTWDAPSGGQFANINRPTAGAQFDRDLPQGEHPFQLYSLATPNGQKVSILFEELLAAGHSGAEYDAWRIDIGEGDQFGSGFVALNPNSKIPALLDRRDPARPVRVFESGSILLHLADAFRAFIPASGPERTEVLNWLFWQMGAGPFLGGGFGHFFAYAPEKLEYPINRFAMEAKRQFDVLDKRLAESEWLGAADYSIADIAVYPWYGRMLRGEGYKGADVFLDLASYTNVARWADRIAAREAVRRGVVVNASEGLRERHSAAELDAFLNEQKVSA